MTPKTFLAVIRTIVPLKLNCRSVESLKAEALNPQHMFTHRLKNPHCKVSQRPKMLATHARKRGGSSTVESD